MAESHALATELLGKFMGVAIEETPMSLNQEANEMAPGVKLPEGIFQKLITVQKETTIGLSS